MSFKRRYMDSLLSADPHPAPEPVSGRAITGNWWRRFLASLLDVPSVGEPSSHVALDTAPEPVTGGRAGRQAPKTVLRARFEPALPPVAARSRSWGWAVTGAGLCLIVGFFALADRQSPGRFATQPPPTHWTVPVPGGTNTAGPTPSTVPLPGGTNTARPTGSAPPTPSGTPGQVLWQGTLTFPSQPGWDTRPAVATPATALLAGEALYLCGACSPQVMGGESLTPWNGTQPPTLDQCGSALAAQGRVPGYVSLRVGQMGCFSSKAGTVGYFTVLTASPLSASAIIWHA
ncbi:hypothetical protein ACFQ6N_37430 [Kitasatospora sp. NPDC056446]|uniref:hypothetical protein n=1 Tax=Kitasatospora sp. NPDC056446 TaxID=3345819 RepID=UPI0036A5A7EF